MRTKKTGLWMVVLAGAVAVLALAPAAQAVTLAQLAPDYDAHTPVDGQTSAGKIPDTIGSGSWNFYSSSTPTPLAAPDGTNLKLLAFDTSPSSPVVRLASSYADFGAGAGYFELPAWSSEALIVGQGAPDADELAVHPGNAPGGGDSGPDSARRFTTGRWVAGANFDNVVVSGDFRKIQTGGSNGIDVEFFVNGSSIFSQADFNSGTPTPFHMSLGSIAAGDRIDFVFGPNGNFSGDNSALNATITGDLGLPTTVIAQLRGDYDAHTPVHGVSSQAANIADTQGGGEWSFYSATTQDPTAGGSNLTDLVFDTAASGVRTANAYADPGTQPYTLPAISITQLISGGAEGAPGPNELALHPGEQSMLRQYMVTRWTAGAGEAGQVLVNGTLQDIGVAVDNVTFAVFDNAGGVLLPSQVVGTTQFSFSFETTVGVGDDLWFVVGNQGNYYSDQSAMSLTIRKIDVGPDGDIPEPASALMFALGAAGVAVWRRRTAKARV